MTPLATLVLLAGLGASDAHIKAPIVTGARALSEPGRYSSGLSYEDTIDYYKRAFRYVGGVRWRNIVNLPGIKAKHIQSLRRKTQWEGINIYEKQGKVRVYVIPRADAGPKARRSAKRK